MSSKSAGVRSRPLARLSGSRSAIITSDSTRGSGSGFHSRPSQKLKVAVVAPIPSARVRMTVSE
jgi:hypothetical protein